MTRSLSRTAGLVLILISAAALASCATLTVGSHAERGANFTQYRTWDWGPADAVPTGDPRLDSNPFFEADMRAAIDHQMTRKGYTRSHLAGPPDLLLHYHANFSRTFEVTAGDTTGSCTTNCEPEAYAYEQGSLVIDVIDARTEKAVWRGWSRDNMEGVIDRQDQMERQINAAVAAMFERLPGTL